MTTGDETEAGSARQRVLRTASRLFYEQGLRGVGVNAIAQHSGITKMTLYAHFGSKDGLIAEHLRARDRRWQDDLGRHLAGVSAPGEMLAATFDAYESWVRAEEFRGCGFINAAAELPDPDHPGRAVIAAHKRSVREHLRRIAERADCHAPRDVAGEWFLLLEGAVVTAAHQHDLEPVRHARRAAFRLLPGGEAGNAR
ncbi:TetR/AcrR family transcriptional regulator [Salinifilum aidingensis]